MSRKICENMWKVVDKIVNVVIKKISEILEIQLSFTVIESIVQFVKFGIVGLSNTLLSYLLNIFVLTIMKPVNVSWDYFVANIIAFILSVLWSFFWNNKYVFTAKKGEKSSVVKTLMKTFIAYAFTGIFLSNILSWWLINIWGISKYIAPLFNLIISVPINFIINKFWAFKKHD